MPNGCDQKEYSKHEYVNGVTPDCMYGCGCWMGSSRSGGPTGLDPFGECPNNPKDGKLLGGNADYDYVVTKRIGEIEAKLVQQNISIDFLKKQLEKVEPSKIELADNLYAAKAEIAKKNQLLLEIQRLIEAV